MSSDTHPFLHDDDEVFIFISSTISVRFPAVAGLSCVSGNAAAPSVESVCVRVFSLVLPRLRCDGKRFGVLVVTLRGHAAWLHTDATSLWKCNDAAAD